jgi:hypothetical protein
MTQDDAGSAPMLGSTLAEVGLRDATVGYGLRMGLNAESIACSLASDKARLLERLVELESSVPIKMAAMLAALRRQQANIRRWLDTGIPADAEESRSISEQIDKAIELAEGGR